MPAEYGAYRKLLGNTECSFRWQHRKCHPLRHTTQLLERNKCGGEVVVSSYLTDGQDVRPALNALLRTSGHPKTPSSPASGISCSLICWLLTSLVKAFPGGVGRLHLGTSPAQLWGPCHLFDRAGPAPSDKDKATTLSFSVTSTRAAVLLTYLSEWEGGCLVHQVVPRCQSHLNPPLHLGGRAHTHETF